MGTLKLRDNAGNWIALRGPAGPKGAAGDNVAWLSGAGVPSGATGVVGDWYLNTDNGDTYEKTAVAVWTFRTNIKGPQGPEGTVPSGTAIISTGSYTGNGGAGDRTISLTFSPKFVEIIGRSNAYRYMGSFVGGSYGHIYNVGADSMDSTASTQLRPQPTTNGFIVSGSGQASLNQSGQVFDYLAIG